MRFDVLLYWFCFIPVSPYFQFNLDWHIQIRHSLHYSLDDTLCAFKLLNRYLKDKLIMHLQDHARPHALLFESVVQTDHRDLDKVGIGTLDRHVDSLTL